MIYAINGNYGFISAIYNSAIVWIAPDNLQSWKGKNTLRWDKTSCHRFSANEARFKMGFLAYNLLHLIRRFYLWGNDKRRSIEWVIMRLIIAGARIVYHARYWQVHIASAFSLRHHYRAIFGW